MPRPKKDGKYLNVNIDREIYDRLEQYADELGQTKTVAIERILKQHLDRWDAEKQGSKE